MKQQELLDCLVNDALLDQVAFSELEDLQQEFPHFRAIQVLKLKKMSRANLVLTKAEISDLAVILQQHPSRYTNTSAPKFDKEFYFTNKGKGNDSQSFATVEDSRDPISFVKPIQISEDKKPHYQLPTEQLSAQDKPINVVAAKENVEEIKLDDNDFNVNSFDLTSVEIDLQELKRGSTGHTEEILKEQIQNVLSKDADGDFEQSVLSDLQEIKDSPTEKIHINWKNVPGVTPPEDSLDMPEDQLAFLKKKVESFKQKSREEGKAITDIPIAVKTDEENLKEIDSFMADFREKEDTKPVDLDTINNMIEKSVTDSELPLSESLAEEFVKQGHYEQAINIYKQLGLKNPEKMHTFVAKILEINKKY